MDSGKRRALIRKQAVDRAKKQQDGVVSPVEGTVQIRPFMKWRPTDKGDCPSKKPKEVATTTVREKPATI